MPQSPTLWTANAWRIMWFDNDNHWRGFLIVNEDTGVTDHPCVYDDGSVAYDDPYSIPDDVRLALLALTEKFDHELKRLDSSLLGCTPIGCNPLAHVPSVEE